MDGYGLLIEGLKMVRPEFFLVDLRDFFFRLRVRGDEKIEKSSENDQLTGYFQRFISFLFSDLF